jgi:MFS family permease
MSVDTLQWAVTGYSLVGAAVMVTYGALGDVFGPVLTTARLNERKHHG